MPLAVENLTKESSMTAVRTAINQTIKYLVKNEKKTPEQAAGEAYGIARKQTGRSLKASRGGT